MDCLQPPQQNSVGLIDLLDTRLSSQDALGSPCCYTGIVKLTSAKRKIPNFMLTPHTLNGFWAMVRHESKLRFSKVRYTVAVVLCLPIWK